MSGKNRWDEIVSVCKNKGEISVDELAEYFNVSKSTIRRDLQTLDDLKLIKRYHGGATLNDSNMSEPPMLYKASSNASIKTKVAKYAASLIQDNQMIYIDAGSSTYEMLNYVYAKNITVVTIGIPHLSILKNKKINTYILGGNIRWSTEAVTGNLALEEIEKFYFDIAFVGTNGIDKNAGFTTTNEQEAALKSKVISLSKKAYILADNSKLNKISACRFAGINDVTTLIDQIDGFEDSELNYLLIK